GSDRDALDGREVHELGSRDADGGHREDAPAVVPYRAPLATEGEERDRQQHDSARQHARGDGSGRTPAGLEERLDDGAGSTERERGNERDDEARGGRIALHDHPEMSALLASDHDG